ncbi:unnamed protein product [Rangifer tarandus platyrhynchus]|uniref:Uncharacterized protein n=1 Tax=Rangifer tarandus platyrhynchus TaxID=3082113 RepID=A0AC59Z4G1_RANTA
MLGLWGSPEGIIHAGLTVQHQCKSAGATAWKQEQDSPSNLTADEGHGFCEVHAGDGASSPHFAGKPRGQPCDLSACSSYWDLAVS